MTAALALKLARIETPTGPMIVVIDDQERFRAMDWEEHEARLHTLLARGLRPEAVVLVESKATDSVFEKIAAYFAWILVR